MKWPLVLRRKYERLLYRKEEQRLQASTRERVLQSKLDEAEKDRDGWRRETMK